MKQLSVYFASWDGYADLWEGVFHEFFEYWPDCPYPVYVGSNSVQADNDNVLTLKSKNNSQNWSCRVVKHLSMIDSKYVLLMLDDYFLSGAVDTSKIERVLSYMDAFDAHMVRLHPLPKPDKGVPGCKELGLINVGSVARVNTQPSIWKRDTLISLIKDDESLWEFEINASVRSNHYSGGFFSSWDPLITYNETIKNGLWRPLYFKFYLNKGVITKGDRGVLPKAKATSIAVETFVVKLARCLFSHRIRQIARAKLGLLLKGKK